MNSLKLSGTMVKIPFHPHQTVTVNKIQRNGFEQKIQFINLSGIIVKQFVCANSQVAGFIECYASQYNFKIVD